MLFDNFYFDICSMCKQISVTTADVLFSVKMNCKTQGQKCADCSNIDLKAVTWLRRLVAGLSPQRPEVDPGSVHVGFLVNKVALGQVFPRVLWFSPVNFIPPVLH
jgi:hypothetical protein